MIFSTVPEAQRAMTPGIVPLSPPQMFYELRAEKKFAGRLLILKFYTCKLLPPAPKGLREEVARDIKLAGDEK